MAIGRRNGFEGTGEPDEPEVTDEPEGSGVTDAPDGADGDDEVEGAEAAKAADEPGTSEEHEPSDEHEALGLDDDELDEVVTPFTEVERVVAGDPHLTLEDVARRAGLPTQILREVYDAMEWGARPAYDERDVAYAEAVVGLLEFFPLAAVIRALRTRYRAMTSIVVSDLSTVRDHVVAPALASGADPEQLSESLGRATAEMLPLITSQLSEDYRHVLLALIGTDAAAQAVRLEGGRELELTIGFVDIVGFTALSGRIDPGELDHVVSAFEDLVTAVVARTEGVLLAKFVGDAAMLVGSNPVVMANTLLDLVEDRQRLAEAPRRAGLAHGQTLVRAGDYYGPVPNLASRLTDHAHEWSLLASEDLEDTLAEVENLDAERISKVTIQGVGSRRPLKVTRRRRER